MNNCSNCTYFDKNNSRCFATKWATKISESNSCNWFKHINDHMDYEEIMLQISDVMRQANKLRPNITHEEAVKAICKIVKGVN